MGKMKAAIIDQFGGPEVFKICEIEKPEISSDQILIKTLTVSINPIDWKQRKGNHKLILGSPFPIVLAYDVCGMVEQVRSNTSRFKEGDIVCGVLDNKYGGALAEFAKGHENCFTLKPLNLSNEEGAAFPMVTLTALQALRDKAKLKEGQKIIIHGATGGVGHVAVQIAKNMGSYVIAIASEKSKAFIEQFNPDEFIDYTKNDILNIDTTVDVFFDVIGNLSFSKVKHLLNRGGIYLNLNYLHSLTQIPKNTFHQFFSRGKKARSLLMKHNGSDLDYIANLISGNNLKISIDKVFSLEDIQEAHEYAEQGHNKGKNVIVISE